MSDPFFSRPNPPNSPPDLQREPVQLDPILNEGRVGRFKTTVTLVAAMLIILLVLFAATRETPEQKTAGPVSLPPSTETGAGTTWRGTQPGAQLIPSPTEQDPIEQNTRP